MTTRKTAAPRNVALENHLRAFREFAAKYGHEFEGKPEVSREVLVKAAEVGNTEVFSMVLQMWLAELGITAPPGVFQFTLKTRKGGRPVSKRMEAIDVWLHYKSLPEGERTFGRVAKDLFPEEFAKDNKNAAGRVQKLFRNLENEAVREGLMLPSEKTKLKFSRAK